MAVSSPLRQAGRRYRRVGHPPAKKGQPKTQVQKTERGAPLARGARPALPERDDGSRQDPARCERCYKSSKTWGKTKAGWHYAISRFNYRYASSALGVRPLTCKKG